MKIKIKRVYEKPDKEESMRILVDRLWPRGLTKEKVMVEGYRSQYRTSKMIWS